MNRSALFLVAFLALAAPAAAQMEQHATYRIAFDHDQGVIAYLPDAVFTPGTARTTDTKQVCAEKTAQFRKTTRSMKNAAYREYGATKAKGRCCEVDHLIPLELGGADELVNLWPQPYPQAHWKDAVEIWLHREVCAGRRDLREAQHAIAANWYALYVEMTEGGKDSPPSGHDPNPASARQFSMLRVTP